MANPGLLQPSWKSGKPRARGELTPPRNSRWGRTAPLGSAGQTFTKGGLWPHKALFFHSETENLGPAWRPSSCRPSPGGRELSRRPGGVQAGGRPWGHAAPGPAPPAIRGCPTAMTPEGPGQRRRAGGNKGSEDSPQQRSRPRRLPESAARPPGHMARSRAEDQRGFVASEQGGSQSGAGRGRRDCSRLRRENRHAGAGRGERRGGRRGEGAPPPPPRKPPGSREALSARKKRGGAEFPSRLGRPQGRSRGPWESAPGRREGEAHLDVQPAAPASGPRPHRPQAPPHSPSCPLPGCWVAPRIWRPVGVLSPGCPAPCFPFARCTPAAPPAQP